MTPIPILSGIYATSKAEFRESLPRNLEPFIVETGLSKGFLRAAPGLTTIATGPGEDRGSITWNGVCYRVMGTKLVSVVGSMITELGDVGSGGPVSMDYSFDLLAIASGGGLYYYDGTSVTQVTDPDLGTVLDVQWIDGFFMTTDGDAIVVTELGNPYAVDPNKYGSSEIDPDPILALRKIRGEPYALNRYSIENFQNVGGNGFPFQRNSGGMIEKGCVGTHAVADFLDSFAFVGGARDEAISVYAAGSGEAVPIATAEIDRELAALTDDEQAAIEVEARIEKGEQRLLIHLPTKTLVYYHQASQANQSPVWAILASGVQVDQQYAARHFVLAESRWIGGSADGVVGYLDDAVETHFGNVAGWLFDTAFIYNKGLGGIIRALELVGLPGRAPFGVNPTCFLSMTHDGQTWGQERAVSMGAFGERRKRVQWRPKTRFSNYVGLRFRGANTAIASWATLQADIEPLNA